ncbi:MAG: AMP-dependent synthetase [Phycisphaerae bacterium]|nr:MAG: AMP-dependent synthetase [Phycisphaerae bacterium]
MSFLDDIYITLEQSSDRSVISEIHESSTIDVDGHELRKLIQQARRYIRQAGVSDGRRCVLVGVNSIHWVAMDLAIIAQGGIVVPLYDRMSPEDQVAIMHDCRPVLVVCGDEQIQQAVHDSWPGAPPSCVLGEVFHDEEKAENWQDPPAIPPDRVVAIIYTSGTSGVSKGVMLTCANLDFMLDRTVTRFDQLLTDVSGRQRFFHYLPFCFAGSWFLLLSSLMRGNKLYLSMDLQRIRDELKQAQPHFFMNVPTFLERIKRGVENAASERGGFGKKLLARAKTGWSNRMKSKQSIGDRVWLALAERFMFRKVRDGVSKDLRAIVCGSAPLTEETQHFFEMMGIKVLQVYGLTETTAICTMDLEDDIQAGWVGHPIDGVEMRLGENDEVQVRGPNVFAGYWNRKDETNAAFDGEWFRTGDQGVVSPSGNWKITGRIKDLIILNSGHNIAPEPLEAALLEAIAGATHTVLVGNSRSFLGLLLFGEVEEEAIPKAMEAYNDSQTQYKRVHAFYKCDKPLESIEGMLTANGKLRRSAIAKQFEGEIDRMYERKAS